MCIVYIEITFFFQIAQKVGVAEKEIQIHIYFLVPSLSKCINCLDKICAFRYSIGSLCSVHTANCARYDDDRLFTGIPVTLNGKIIVLYAFAHYMPGDTFGEFIQNFGMFSFFRAPNILLLFSNISKKKWFKCLQTK